MLAHRAEIIRPARSHDRGAARIQANGSLGEAERSAFGSRRGRGSEPTVPLYGFFMRFLLGYRAESSAWASGDRRPVGSPGATSKYTRQTAGFSLEEICNLRSSSC
jgi:hypothetical protein